MEDILIHSLMRGYEDYMCRNVCDISGFAEEIEKVPGFNDNLTSVIDDMRLLSTNLVQLTGTHKESNKQ